MKNIPMERAIGPLIETCKLLNRLPKEHKDAIFFSVIGHYMCRISLDVNTIKKIEIYNREHKEEIADYQDYQTICSAMRRSLENEIDIQLILQNTDSSIRVRDWDFLQQVKWKNRVTNFYGNKVPPEYQFLMTLTCDQNKIRAIKEKYNWEDRQNYWHGYSLENAIKQVKNTRCRNRINETYIDLYSIMNWGTHGSGDTIQTMISPNVVGFLVDRCKQMISMCAILSSMDVLKHEKIKFLDNGIMCAILQIIYDFELNDLIT